MIRQLALTVLLAAAAQSAPTVCEHCPSDDKPVCASDQMTYNNDCVRKCLTYSHVVKVHDGPCGSPSSQVQVDNANGVQVADANGVQVAENSDPCTCTRSYKPVCGSNGETYNNECLLNCVATTDAMARSPVTKIHDGPCLPAGSQVIVAEPCTCTRAYKPVCGTNGETYNNECLLNCVALKHVGSSGVALKHVGPCGSDHVASGNECDCGRELEPVCGSNGVKYNNKCLFDCALTWNPGMTIAHPSRCRDLPPCCKNIS